MLTEFNHPLCTCFKKISYWVADPIVFRLPGTAVLVNVMWFVTFEETGGCADMLTDEAVWDNILICSQKGIAVAAILVLLLFSNNNKNKKSYWKEEWFIVSDIVWYSLNKLADD